MKLSTKLGKIKLMRLITKTNNDRLFLTIYKLMVFKKGLPKIMGQKSSCGEPRTSKSVGYFIFPHKTSTLSAFWERGSPDLPACGLRRGSSGGPVWPIFINSSSRPSRGAKPRRVDVSRLPQERPHQAGSRGGGEIKARDTSQGSRDASHDDQGQAGASSRSVLVSPLVLRGKRRRGVPRQQAKVSISVKQDQDQQDEGHCGAQDSVTTEAFGRQRLLLSG